MPPPKLPKRPQGPRIGPANNANHWKDWQKRHRAPRPIDLLRKIHDANQQLKTSAQKTLTPEQEKEVEEFGVIETFDENDS